MRTMKPVAHKFLAGDAFTLRDLGFVMRKNVIDAAAVNVDLIAEQRGGHCAAFDVPARAAATPRTFPADVAIFFIPRFPKREIANVLLVVFVVLYAAGRLQLGEIEMGELPVIRKFINAKI